MDIETLKDVDRVYFVRDGVMRTAQPLHSVEMNHQSLVPPRRHQSPVDAALEMFFSHDIQLNHSQNAHWAEILVMMLERPGTWVYLTGMDVVHIDDLYETQEQAAMGEYHRLTTEGN